MKIVIDKIDKTEYVNSCKMGFLHSIQCYSEFRACIIASFTAISIYNGMVYDKGIGEMTIKELNAYWVAFELKY
jgi:hypothetical protein